MHKILVIILLFGFFSCKNQETQQTVVLDKEKVNHTEANTQENHNLSGINQNSPEYLNVDLQGYQVPNVNLKEFYGEVIFVNFWGSWCPPCRMEMPSIQSLYDDYGDRVKFAMIAFEKQSGAHIRFVDENGYDFPVYEAVSPMSSELKPEGFPTTLIINKKGEVLLKDIGAKDWNTKEVRGKLDQLLAE